MRNLKKISKTSTIVVTTLTLIFLIKTFIKYQEQTQDIVLSIPSIRIIISFSLFLSYLYILALSWRYLAHSLGESINKKDSLSIWFFSQATRYIPGNIWSFVSRSYLARKKNVSRNASFLILPIEVILITIASTVLSSYAIIKTTTRLPVNLIFYILIAMSITATLGLLILYKKIKKIFSKLFTQTLVLKPLITAFVLQLIGWSLYSIGTLVLIDNITKVDNLFLLFSSTLLAWLVGYLTIVSPMGLGVRESAFVLLTGQQIGIAQAITIALLARIILTAAELVNLAFWASINFRELKTLVFPQIKLKSTFTKK